MSQSRLRKEVEVGRRVGVTILDEDLHPTALVYTNASRPDAASVGPGTMIFNSDDNAPNWSDGTDWRAADGTIT